MTEKELINAGFKRVDVSAEESGMDFPYHFFNLSNEDESLSLLTNANDEANTAGEWSVSGELNMATPLTIITDIKDVILLQKLIAKWQKKNKLHK
jgi:hypothetical protein